MPIDSRHPDYISHYPEWSKCSDFNEGATAVKEKGKLYLPRPQGMTAYEYNAYRHRASFFNGVGRTVTGLVGAMSRVDAEVTLPPLISDLKEDATGNGKTLQELIKQVLSRVMTTGRIGILVDRKDNDPARLIPYNEKSIVNWREENGQLILVVLEEFILETDEKDPYESEIVPQYRELWIDNESNYKARIWQRVKTKSSTARPKFSPGPVISPQSSKGPLKYIPFVFCSPVGTESAVVKAPLVDLCDINLSHYMVSADLEHGRHMVSLPTPWVTGINADDYKKGLKIGSGTAWLIDDTAARVGMLEFTGNGLGHLAEAISEKQHQMAIMGAKLLQPQRKQVESAELARMANAGDESILIGISKSVGLGMESALQFAAEWEGASPEAVDLRMNVDFIDTKLAADEIKALNELYLSDVISLMEFLEQLKLGERLVGDPEEVAAEAVSQADAKQKQALVMAATTRSNDAGGDRENGAAERDS